MTEAGLDRVTIRPVSTFSYLVLPDAEWKVLRYEDHVDIRRSDSRGRWRRRKTLPPELTKYEDMLTKYEISTKPEVG